jgi:6-phosphogluconolactonase (cycloisomerase 2 family)
MMNRRSFAALVAGAIAVPKKSWGQVSKAKTVFYASVGPELTLYDVDVDGATLTRRSSVTLPAGVQYAWPHPSRRFFYVASSNGQPGGGPVNQGDKHYASAFRVDPNSGALTPHGQALTLDARPIHISVDGAGQFAMIAYNDPSNVTVHRIDADGTLGATITQRQKLDIGIYSHQIRTTPSNRTAILVCRGNNPAGGKPEDPGSLKVFGFRDGQFTNLASYAPGNGYGFGPRHLDFHPTLPFVYISLERQNKLYTYGLEPDGTLSRDPLFMKDSLAEPQNRRPGQGAGTLHVHPNGRFLYQANRNSSVVDFEGKKVFAGGENNMAVWAIDQKTGEPALIQNADGHANQLRTFGLDASGRMLVAASVNPILMREGNNITNLSAGLTVYRVGGDGKLTFARKYDVDTAKGTQFWSGMVTLA